MIIAIIIWKMFLTVGLIVMHREYEGKNTYYPIMRIDRTGFYVGYSGTLSYSRLYRIIHWGKK